MAMVASDDSPGAVNVVEQALHRRVVDGEDGVIERAVLVHRAESVDAGRRLLTAADDGFDEFGMVLVDGRDHVHAVVHRDGGFEVDDGLDGLVVTLVVHAALRVAGDVRVFVQRGAHVVVGRKRVASGDGDFRATLRERLHEDCGLRLDVHRHADSLALKRFVGDELLLNRRHYRHVLARPVHLAVPLDASGLQIVQLLADRRIVCHTCEMDERVENGTEGGQRLFVVEVGATVVVTRLPLVVSLFVAVVTAVSGVVTVGSVSLFVFRIVTVPVVVVGVVARLRLVGLLLCIGVVGRHPRRDDSPRVFHVLSREQFVDERGDTVTEGVVGFGVLVRGRDQRDGRRIGQIPFRRYDVNGGVVCRSR